MPSPIHYDLLLVGASTSNLILAHRLVDLAAASGLKLSIALVEKSLQFGAHIVSGAISDPHVIEKVFPDYRTNGFPVEGYVQTAHLSVLGSEEKWDLPNAVVPKGFRKEGHAILTLSHVIRWLAENLQAKAKDVPNIELDVFPGFAAHEILYAGEQVIGVKVSESGSLDEDALYADFTCFGDKGFISKDLVERFKLRPNPQLWSVGIKELWEVDMDYQGVVWHTLGYPILDGTFSGGFVYGLSDKRLAIGLVISLDSKNPNINPQLRLQQFKAHPWIQELIAGGKLRKYGAAVIPEGGFYSLPTRFGVEGAILLGDALGVLDAASLSGVDKSMETGYIAAGLLHDAFVRGDLTWLAEDYRKEVMASFVGQDLYASRHFRRAFLENDKLLGEYLPAVARSVDQGHPWLGSLKFGLGKPIQRSTETFHALSLILGKTSSDAIFRYTPCHENIEPAFNTPTLTVNPQAKVETLLSRPDAVFFSATRYHEGNRHIEEFDPTTCLGCIATYDRLGKPTPCVSDCTAEVHRIDAQGGVRVHGMSLENCIQCRTCEIVCPQANLRVNPTFEGSGPDFYGL